MHGARFRDEKLCSCAGWRFNCSGAVITANTVVSSGKTLYRAAPLETKFSTLLQRFTAESSRELRRNVVP